MNSNVNTPIVWSVSDFVAVVNQTLDFAFPNQKIVGEVANFKVSRNRWVYFDLKDEYSSMRCFGSVFSLHTVIEDGMVVIIDAVPKLHPQFGFSLNFETIAPSGEGSIKRASTLLEAKLRKEGLFEDSRKRFLPYPPKTIGLITSLESAAYHDFVKVLGARWCGLDIQVFDVKVQGQEASEQIVKAINFFNSSSDREVLVITRGGGSKDDLSAFDSELLVRAVASSRIPTLVAIGHEVDLSLAELAADKRASTPSNAAELLTPDKKQTLELLSQVRTKMSNIVQAEVSSQLDWSLGVMDRLHEILNAQIYSAKKELGQNKKLVMSMHPNAVLKRGYAIIKIKRKSISKVTELSIGSNVEIILQDGLAQAKIAKTKVE